MAKAIVMVAACVALHCAGTAVATPTPQQSCDYARVKEWTKYVSCVDSVVAKTAKGASFDEFAALARCRHAYFQKWTTFQSKASLAGSTCIGARFTDNGDGTVSDNLTLLVWEKKTTDATVHDQGNLYMWSTGSNNEDGTAFTTFLADALTSLNVAGFAGANGWRLPTLPELHCIVLDFPCSGAGDGATCQCGSSPCIDATLGPTESDAYWSATGYLSDPSFAWIVGFDAASAGINSKTFGDSVRAVRGGL